MKFKLEIELGNDAMRTARHVNAALRKVAASILCHEDDDEEGLEGKVISGVILDENGRKVGRWEVT